jgi:hypothetical protein
VAPAGPWRDAMRERPTLLSVFAWSDVVPRDVRSLLAGTALSVIGHLVQTVDHGLEVFCDALAQDVAGALDGAERGPTAAAAGPR